LKTRNLEKRVKEVPSGKRRKTSKKRNETIKNMKIGKVMFYTSFFPQFTYWRAGPWTVEVEERKIPRTMSTQHPDNVNLPEWSQDQLSDGNRRSLRGILPFTKTLVAKKSCGISEGEKTWTTRVSCAKLLSNYLGLLLRKHSSQKDIYLHLPASQNPTI